MQQSELIKDVLNGHFEEDGGQILLPRSRVLARGLYVHSVNGQDERTDENLVVDQFLTYLLNTGVASGSASANWYMALYSANYTPLASLTAASFSSTASEITSGTEGYTQSTRVQWTQATITTPVADNYASRSVFTIATASSLSVNGIGVLSASAKGATTGTLMSAVLFTSTRTLFNTDSFQVGYRITLTGV